MKKKQLFITLLLVGVSVTSLSALGDQKATANQLKGLALLQKDKEGNVRSSVLHDYCASGYTEQCVVINKALEGIDPSWYTSWFGKAPTSVEITIAIGKLMSDYVKSNPEVMSNTLTAACEDEKRIQEILKDQA